MVEGPGRIHRRSALSCAGSLYPRRKRAGRGAERTRSCSCRGVARPAILGDRSRRSERAPRGETDRLEARYRLGADRRRACRSRC